MTTEARTIASGYAFLEAPRWRDGFLYVSDIFGREVLKFTEDGQAERICEVSSRPSGLAWDANGNLLVSSMGDQRVLRLQDGDLEVFADLSGTVRGDVNDMISDGHGGVYLGSFGFGPAEDLVPTQLVHISEDGTVTTAADDLVFPNGMAITPDGRTLLVAETFASRISAFDITAPGHLINRRDWAAFQETPEIVQPAAVGSKVFVAPDGICLDAEGCLWVADPRGNAALRVAPGGQVVDDIKINSANLSVFAVALGGEDKKTLYMCAGPKMGSDVNLEIERQSELLAVKVNVPGA
ncbi:SMP-30/gluconolactonase/LRE family protein [Paenarthrobacter sp. NPDC057981]|uniref:SMP-30/gluconolactonase/LRE family protein n=1 Tax=Paenarthrobacter sp. NPDC057981 TaxID=3346297 RepID=UPI0036DD058E